MTQRQTGPAQVCKNTGRSVESGPAERGHVRARVRASPTRSLRVPSLASGATDRVRVEGRCQSGARPAAESNPGPAGPSAPGPRRCTTQNPRLGWVNPRARQLSDTARSENASHPMGVAGRSTMNRDSDGESDGRRPGTYRYILEKKSMYREHT
jgi:hypothetical protein